MQVVEAQEVVVQRLLHQEAELQALQSQQTFPVEFMATMEELVMTQVQTVVEVQINAGVQVGAEELTQQVQRLRLVVHQLGAQEA